MVTCTPLPPHQSGNGYQTMISSPSYSSQHHEMSALPIEVHSKPKKETIKKLNKMRKEVHPDLLNKFNAASSNVLLARKINKTYKPLILSGKNDEFSLEEKLKIKNQLEKVSKMKKDSFQLAKEIHKFHQKPKLIKPLDTIDE